MRPKVVAVVGGKKVGKTTTTENLIAELTRRDYKVAAIKHISEPNWTIDTPGKDTFRFGQKGANPVIAVGREEIATIEKSPTKSIDLQALFEKAPNVDIILTEGLKREVAQRADIPKVAVVTSKEQVQEALERYKPILAFSGPYNPENLASGIPYVDAIKEPSKLAELIENKLLKN